MFLKTSALECRQRALLARSQRLRSELISTGRALEATVSRVEQIWQGTRRVLQTIAMMARVKRGRALMRLARCVLRPWPPRPRQNQGGRASTAGGVQASSRP